MRPVSVSQLLYGSAALSVAAASALPEDDTPLPLVIWHGTSPSSLHLPSMPSKIESNNPRPR